MTERRRRKTRSPSRPSHADQAGTALLPVPRTPSMVRKTATSLALGATALGAVACGTPPMVSPMIDAGPLDTMRLDTPGPMPQPQDVQDTSQDTQLADASATDTADVVGMDTQATDASAGDVQPMVDAVSPMPGP